MYLNFLGRVYVKGVEIEKEGDAEKAIITLGRDDWYICSSCGSRVYKIHSSFIQEARHLHLWRYMTVFRFKKVRVRCSDCRVKVERLDFLEKNKRVTKELTHQVSELCKVMTTDVAMFEHLHWEAVKDIDKKE